MDLDELKRQFESISSELKSKAPKELAVLVDSQTLLIGIMLEQNARLNATLEELQETIKELCRQLEQNSRNRSRTPSKDGG